MGQGFALFGGDQTFAEGNLFDAADFQALAFFNGFNEVGCLQQGFVGARVQPGKAAAQEFDLEVAAGQVGVVHRGDLQLAPGRRLDGCGNGGHVVVVKIQAGHGAF